jgi:hypothetical protein
MAIQFRFYATKIDLLNSLDALDQVLDLQYFDAWVHDSEDIPRYKSLRDWSELGVSPGGREGDAGFFFVNKGAADLAKKQINYNDGTVGYKYDAALNPESIVFKPSGMLITEHSKKLVCGMCGTASCEANSRLLYNIFKKTFLGGYKRLKGGAYLGKDAELLMSDTKIQLSGLDA